MASTTGILKFLLLICSSQTVTSFGFGGFDLEGLDFGRSGFAGSGLGALGKWKEIFKNVPKMSYSNEQIQVYKEIVNDDGANDPEKYYNTAELAENEGYVAETHYIITEDGYNLTVFRILSNDRQNASKSFNGTDVVILGHGLFSSSDDWVTSGKNRSIALLLADEGYDVWIINYRGHKYSRQHISLNPDTDGSFWDFSFDEMGRFDLPATIDYVLGHTGQSSVKHVTHALGASIFLVMGSERPEYVDKVSAYVGLSVLVWLSHTTSPLLRLLAIGDPLFKAAEALGIHEILENNPFTNTVKDVLCGTQTEAKLVCSNALELLLGGLDTSQVDKSRVNIIAAHFPAAISLKMAQHVGQVMKSGEFRKFNYGSLKNNLKYKSKSPPKYDLSKINTPVAVLRGENDMLSKKEDIDILIQHLPNVVELYTVPYKSFNHADFFWAKNMSTLVFPKIKELLQKY